MSRPSVRPSRLASCCGFVHTERRPSELGISMRAEGSKNISPWFSRFISDSITLDMLLESEMNFGEVNHLKQQTRNTGHGKALFPGKRVQQQEIYHIACLKQNVG